MNDETQKKQLERLTQALDQSTQDLDGSTLSKLTQARHAAVAAAGSPRRARWPAVAVLGGSTAALGLVALMMTSQLSTTPAAPENLDAVADFELLAASSDDLEMLEDLEFFEWLGSTDLSQGMETG